MHQHELYQLTLLLPHPAGVPDAEAGHDVHQHRHLGLVQPAVKAVGFSG